MRIRGLRIALLIAIFALVGFAMTLSYRRSMAEIGLPAPATSAGSQAKPTDRGAQFESEILAFERKVVTGAPFSAILLIEQIPEGSSETRTSTSLIYRDTEGRTRRDQMRANSANDVETTTINDPVAGFAYELRHSDSTARRTKLSPHVEKESRDSMAAMQNSVAAQERASAYQMLPVPADGNPKGLKPKAASVVAGLSNSESLGEKEIEGVMAEGTRTIVTIPAGAMGNDRALEIVTERWYSSKLNTVILIERLDPRFGRSVFRLTRIQRTDPTANLFSVPGKYKVLIE